MWAVLGFVALLALVGMVVLLSRCPVMIQTTRERETERYVHVVQAPVEVHHVHHVHAAAPAPHTQVATHPTPAPTTPGPMCPCGCGLLLGQVQGPSALGPTPDTIAATGRVVPALERPQR